MSFCGFAIQEKLHNCQQFVQGIDLDNKKYFFVL